MNSNNLITTLLAGVAAVAAVVAHADGPALVVTSLKPNPPIVGVNRLEVSAMDSAGKPAAGLHLTATVAMTSMDMGVAHPAVTALGQGRYRVDVEFAMKGPWRVTLADGSAFSRAFEFQPGSGERWTDTASPPNGATAAMADHLAMRLPRLQESKVTQAGTDMNLTDNAGFGKNAAMVAMMNLMMVGGSGMEGMKMTPADLKFDAANYEGADVSQESPSSPDGLKVSASVAKAAGGDSRITLEVRTKDGKPIVRAKIGATVEMVGMDMGTTHPKVKELGKGKYVLVAHFAMAGAWRVRLAIAAQGLPKTTCSVNVEAK